MKQSIKRLMAMIMARGTILSCVCNVGMNLKSIKINIDKDSIQSKCIEMKNKAFEYEKELINDSQYISF